MKRIAFFLVIMCLLAVASCSKDKSVEGVFQPKYRISTITNSATNSGQSWTWGSSRLSSITDSEEGTAYTFSYTGDLMASVSITYDDGTPTETIYYTYQGDYLSKIEVVSGTTSQYTMDVYHDADDHISSMNIEVSDAYLVDLAREMAFKSKTHRAISHIVSPAAIRAMASTVSAFDKTRPSLKSNIENKHFSLEYQWNGDNLVSEKLSGNVSAVVSIEDIAEAFDFGALTSIVTSVLGDQEWPLSATVLSTTTYTYDNNVNPWRYCWKEGLTASNLSENNPLTIDTKGSADATITLILPETIPFVGGMEYPFDRSVPLDEKTTCTYSYNGKKCPVTMGINGVSYTISYE